MGYNRTVCMLSVTSVDICLNSHLGANGAIGLRSLGDVLFLWYMWQLSLGSRGVRTRKQIKHDGRKKKERNDQD